MKKKYIIIIILMFFLFSTIVRPNCVRAVFFKDQMDKDNKIKFSSTMNSKDNKLIGTITLTEDIANYKLSYQIVMMNKNQYNAINNKKTEINNYIRSYNEIVNNRKEKLKKLKEKLETIRNNKNISNTEKNKATKDYNNKALELKKFANSEKEKMQKMKLEYYNSIPNFTTSWISTTNKTNNVNISTDNYNGQIYYALWAKADNGTDTYYDCKLYTNIIENKNVKEKNKIGNSNINFSNNMDLKDNKLIGTISLTGDLSKYKLSYQVVMINKNQFITINNKKIEINDYIRNYNEIVKNRKEKLKKLREELETIRNNSNVSNTEKNKATKEYNNKVLEFKEFANSEKEKMQKMKSEYYKSIPNYTTSWTSTTSKNDNVNITINKSSGEIYYVLWAKADNETDTYYDCRLYSNIIENNNKENANKESTNKENSSKENTNKESTNKENTNKENTNKENSNKENTNKENTNKENSNKENTNKENTNKENKNKENTNKENNNKENSNKENTNKESTNKENSSKENANKEKNNNNDINNNINNIKDSSNMNVELKKSGNSLAVIELKGNALKQNSVYYYYIGNSLTELDINNIDKSKLKSFKFTEATYNYILNDEKIRDSVERNKNIYFSILEEKDNKLNPLIINKKLTKYLENRFADAFSGTLISDNHNLITTTFTHNNKNQRKMKVRIGKITNKDILQKIKSGEQSGFEELMTYSKSASTVYDNVMVCNGSKSIQYDTMKESELIKPDNIENGAYYFLYVKTDDENGKYSSNEAITIAKANSTTDKNWVMQLYGTDDFKWEEFDSNNSNKTSDKIIDKKITNTTDTSDNSDKNLEKNIIDKTTINKSTTKANVNDTINSKDITTVKASLPYTGKSALIFGAIIGIFAGVGAIISYKKMQKI